MRQGSQAARELFLVLDERGLNSAIGDYHTIVVDMARYKHKEELIELDQWLWASFRNDVEQRNPRFVTKDELAKIMKWKLMRGKFRPTLQGLIDQNTSSQVETISRESLAALQEGDWQTALLKMTKLRGVGPGV
jgi:exoribonuclease II